MELKHLYEIQGGLKAHIDYKGEDKFSRMMLALIVEIGECANDWQRFKYWKKHNEPKTDIIEVCPCPHCDGFCSNNSDEPQNHLLEECVDVLHFVLETGIDLKDLGLIETLPEHIQKKVKEKTITKQFKTITMIALKIDSNYEAGYNTMRFHYVMLLEYYFGLCEMLGFSDGQIVDAYMSKNKENHDRQIRNY